MKGLQEKAQEYCKTQEKDFEQIKKEYAKVREENIKLKEDLTVEAEKIKRIINKSSDSSEVLQLKSEIEVIFLYNLLGLYRDWFYDILLILLNIQFFVIILYFISML